MVGYVALGVVVLLVVYATLDMQRVAIRRYSLKAKDDLKILQISDLHKRRFGKGNARLVSLVAKESPDVVVCTGDLVSRDQTDFDDVVALVREVCKLSKVYYVMGNHESDMPIGDYNALVGVFESLGATLLDGQKVSIAEHTQLWGLTLPIRCYHDGNHHYRGLYYYTTSDVRESLGSPKRGDYNVLLAHNPFFFDSYHQWGADLTLCGHVHGGIVRLPLINGLLSPERKLLPKYSGGLYSMGKSSMVVSRGLGKLRLFNPPEVSVITLVR